MTVEEALKDARTPDSDFAPSDPAAMCAILQDRANELDKRCLGIAIDDNRRRHICHNSPMATTPLGQDIVRRLNTIISQLGRCALPLGFGE